ncbi:MAG TPA: TetR/AcrR family transcriptional regulator [Bryobacteraceae bacterium]|nr:TetR/AcrR family transcriptional regulator [Bryobacteraceae bacterium]
MTKGEQTRHRVVAEAAKLFNQRGYEGSSMSDIMQVTGLEKGGIYRHFSSKEELAAAAFDFAWNEAVQLRSHDVAGIKNSVDKLRKLIANFVERRSPIPGGCPLLNTAVDTDDGNPVLRKHAAKALHAWQARLIGIIQEGIERGEVNPETEPEKLANVVISCLEGALMIARLERKSDALLNAQAHLDMYLEAVVRL